MWNFHYISTFNLEVTCRCINFSQWTQGSQITTENKLAWPEKWEQSSASLTVCAGKERRTDKCQWTTWYLWPVSVLSSELSETQNRVKTHNTTWGPTICVCVCVCVYMARELFSRYYARITQYDGLITTCNISSTWLHTVVLLKCLSAWKTLF